jgi:hypothetical protein
LPRIPPNRGGMARLEITAIAHNYSLSG